MTRSASVGVRRDSQASAGGSRVQGCQRRDGLPASRRKMPWSGWRRSEGSHDRQPAKDRETSADAPRARHECVPLSRRSPVCAVKPTPARATRVSKPHATTGVDRFAGARHEPSVVRVRKRTHLSSLQRAARSGGARIARPGRPTTLDGGVCIGSGDTGARCLSRSDSNRCREAAAWTLPRVEGRFSDRRWSGFTRVVALNRRRRAGILVKRCVPPRESGEVRTGSRDRSSRTPAAPRQRPPEAWSGGLASPAEGRRRSAAHGTNSGEFEPRRANPGDAEVDRGEKPRRSEERIPQRELRLRSPRTDDAR